jgi:hypothetical protein
MSKGLKQMVAEEAMQSAPKRPPVEVSGEATRALSEYVRQWAGWPTARVVFGPTSGLSPWAECHHDTLTFLVNVDELVLNPNRVLLSVTPFRLRQEAVLTGTLLHEAGHARHSKWAPRTTEAVAGFRHRDGEVPNAATMALARLMEEPRVEGLMFRDADKIGALGLGWTMRASAAHLVPTTALSMDPNRRIMDIITSWALRAGRQIALHSHSNSGYEMRNWVQDFTTLLHGAIVEHLTVAEQNGADVDVDTDARRIIDLLIEMCGVTDDRGSTMIDKARDVLALLFPETDPDEQPAAGGGCGPPEPAEDESDEDAKPDDKGGESNEDGSEGKGNTEPEDEGSGADPGAGDSGEDEAEPAEPEAGDGAPEDEAEPAEPEGGQDGQSEPDGGETEDQSGESGASASTDTGSELAQALANMEAAAKSETEDEAEDEAEEAEEEAAKGAGAGAGAARKGGWRDPSPKERDIQKGAEKFLRGLINPSEASKVTLDDAPAATVDGAALAAWKAGGQHSSPKFFRRTRRTVEPSPPIRIAVLVDVSTSMEELQKPSAVLSWALAASALDLRNFAGRGQQVESCLIHWGSSVRTIQKNGETLPGIREWGCFEGTSAMAEALDEVEVQMPGFFDMSERPVNRLLVQFTDWELFGRMNAVPRIRQALEAGVNMLTVAPHNYAPRRSDLDAILRECKVQRGASTLIRYNPMFPQEVWETAAEKLT